MWHLNWEGAPHGDRACDGYVLAAAAVQTDDGGGDDDDGYGIDDDDNQNSKVRKLSASSLRNDNNSRI